MRAFRASFIVSESFAHSGSSGRVTFGIAVIVVWDCLTDGAHALQRKRNVFLASLVEVELFLPERQPFRGIGHQAAAVRPSRFEFFDSPK